MFKKSILAVLAISILAPHGAHAEPGRVSERLAAQVGMFTGAAAVLNFDAKFKTRLGGAAILTIGTGLLQDAMCANALEDRVSCSKVEGMLREAVMSSPEVVASLRSGTQMKTCPSEKIEKETSEKVIEIYDTLKENSNEPFQGYMPCVGPAQKDLRACLKRVGHALDALCIDYRKLKVEHLPSPEDKK